MNGYVLRHPTRDDKRRLSEFSKLIWPNESPDKLSSRWWWKNTDKPECWLAEHQSSGDIAAMCGARRSRFWANGKAYNAVSICDWDVSPYHKNKGLGRQLLQKASEGFEICYTTSISESAAKAFSQLGWHSDSRIPIYLGNPYLSAFLGQKAHSPGVDIRTVNACSNLPIDERLFDNLWERTKHSGYVGMIRNAQFLMDLLKYSPERNYQLSMAFSGGALEGYMLFRTLPQKSFRRLPLTRVGLISDFLCAPNSQVFGPLMAHATTSFAKQRVSISAILTTDISAKHDLVKLGFTSANQPLFRNILHSAHTRCMLSTSEDIPDLERWHLTFADNDMDLIFGSTAGV